MPLELSRTTDKIKPMKKAVVLLVDDDQLITESLSFILNKKYQIYIAESRTQAKKIISSLQTPPQLALVDLGLPPLPHQADEGFELIEELLVCDPQMKILILSGQSGEMNIQHALTLGAVDSITKPVDADKLQSRLQHHHMLQLREKEKIKSLTDSVIIGDSSCMQVLREQIERYSATLFPILIEGESGTGKELIARAIYEESIRKDNFYEVINCSATSADLLEAKLFGYVEGDYSAGNYDSQGLLAKTNVGTIFLDEIGEMPYSLQIKLVKFMDSGEYYRKGDTICQKASSRIIAATSKNLSKEVKSGRFRADLYHRLSVLKLQIPALRDREKDSLILKMQFQILFEDSIQHFSLNDEANKLWLEYDFPGNVRELKNLVIRLGTKYPGKIVKRNELESELELEVETEVVESLKTGFKSGRFNDMWLMKEIASGDLILEEAINELENHCIDIAMNMYDGNISKVASVLHISRGSLFSRIQNIKEKGAK